MGCSQSSTFSQVAERTRNRIRFTTNDNKSKLTSSQIPSSLSVAANVNDISESRLWEDYFDNPDDRRSIIVDDRYADNNEDERSSMFGHEPSDINNYNHHRNIINKSTNKENTPVSERSTLVMCTADSLILIRSVQFTSQIADEYRLDDDALRELLKRLEESNQATHRAVMNAMRIDVKKSLNSSDCHSDTTYTDIVTLEDGSTKEGSQYGDIGDNETIDHDDISSIHQSVNTNKNINEIMNHILDDESKNDHQLATTTTTTTTAAITSPITSAKIQSEVSALISEMEDTVVDLDTQHQLLLMVNRSNNSNNDNNNSTSYDDDTDDEDEEGRRKSNVTTSVTFSSPITTPTTTTPLPLIHSLALNTNQITNNNNDTTSGSSSSHVTPKKSPTGSTTDTGRYSSRKLSKPLVSPSSLTNTLAETMRMIKAMSNTFTHKSKNNNTPFTPPTVTTSSKKSNSGTSPNRSKTALGLDSSSSSSALSTSAVAAAMTLNNNTAANSSSNNNNASYQSYNNSSSNNSHNNNDHFDPSLNSTFAAAAAAIPSADYQQSSLLAPLSVTATDTPLPFSPQPPSSFIDTPTTEPEPILPFYKNKSNNNSGYNILSALTTANTLTDATTTSTTTSTTIRPSPFSPPAPRTLSSTSTSSSAADITTLSAQPSYRAFSERSILASDKSSIAADSISNNSNCNSKKDYDELERDSLVTRTSPTSEYKRAPPYSPLYPTTHKSIRIQCPGRKIPIRQQPSIDSEVIGYYRNGQVIEVSLQSVQGFYEVKGGVGGSENKGYLNKNTKGVEWIAL